MTIDRYAALLTEISAEWNKAEEDIKIAEQIGDKVVYSSISELRYAGRRLVDALAAISDNADEEAVRNFVQDALFNCHRARHDAIDAATSAMARDLEYATNNFSPEIIQRIYPELHTIAADVKTLRDKISESRKDRGNREAIYGAIEKDDFKKIVDSYLGYKNSRERIIAEQEREEKYRKRLMRNANIGAVIGFVGVAIGLFCLL